MMNDKEEIKTVKKEMTSRGMELKFILYAALHTFEEIVGKAEPFS